MKNNKIKTMLFSTLLVMTLIPILATVIFLDRSLKTTFNLGFNSEITHSLEEKAQHLKDLKQLNPSQSETYKKQFNKTQELLLIYKNKDILKQNVLQSLKIYFWIGLFLAISLALLISFYLSKKINRAYQNTFTKLIKEKERSDYLEEISSWQVLAKMLAHEIKNPLTPIEVLLSDLPQALQKKNPSDFKMHLYNVQKIMFEELQHLKNLVIRFDDFSKLPAVKLKPILLYPYLKDTLNLLKTTFPKAHINFKIHKEHTKVLLDKILFRQVLSNIIRNGLEANKDFNLNFNISLDTSDEVKLQIVNNGCLISDKIVPHIFEPYISSKAEKSNMGLGLAICKKIMVQHKGDIIYQELNGYPLFTLSFKESL